MQKYREYSKFHLQSLIIFEHSKKDSSAVSSGISFDSSPNSSENSKNEDVTLTFNRILVFHNLFKYKVAKKFESIASFLSFVFE